MFTCISLLFQEVFVFFLSLSLFLSLFDVSQHILGNLVLKKKLCLELT